MPGAAALARALAAATGLALADEPERVLAADGLHGAYCWAAASELIFVKVAPQGARAAFEAEAAGLRALAAARALRVPRVLACGEAGVRAFLALEWIETAPATPDTERRLGEGLAALHAVTAPRFGWDRDNTIGRTPQRNDWGATWSDFYREHRLRPQLALAIRQGFGALLEECGGRLLEAVPALLDGHRPSASLLHGDLWAGNWLTTLAGEPVVLDAAVYFGDRETDLAMTRLFGGFGAGFYAAYLARAPLPPGAAERVDLYNLYHVLNHANLFGAAYARQARGLIERLLALVRG
jgi:protein-ribulosamine 3-kinase